MGQILRHHKGPVSIPVSLLIELEWLLDMDTAAPRSVVMPLADQLRDYDRDMVHDDDLNHTVVHDYLTVLEVDAMQRLRGWHRLRYGTITADAQWLSVVRNTLDGLLIDGYGEDCEEYVSQLDYDPAELALVAAAIGRGESCYRCERCQYSVMEDRLDALLDAQGYVGLSYYLAYVAATRDQDPEATWRDRVCAVVS